ncbi:MAG: hypothetical protein HC798_03790 [Polaribacter sp.]|nr:hypothetical protein [Polaribacter sp.]
MKKIVLLIFIFFAYSGYAIELSDAFNSELIVDVSVEAEAGTRNRGATVQSCGSCSGGEHVGDLGGLPVSAPNAYLASVVTVATAGKYTMNLSASSGATRSIFISVNGGDATEVSVNSGDWSTPAVYNLVLNLAVGTNTIKFFNDIS